MGRRIPIQAARIKARGRFAMKLFDPEDQSEEYREARGSTQSMIASKVSINGWGGSAATNRDR
jgi:hypothetical protein